MADDVTSAPPTEGKCSNTPSPQPPPESKPSEPEKSESSEVKQNSTPQPESTPSEKQSTPQSESKSAEKENETPKAETRSGDKASFKERFKAFSKFGDTKSDGKHITLSQSDKWMKQAKVIDGKKITTTDTGIHFKKFKSLKISLEDYKKFLDELAKSKKMTGEELQDKLASCGPPGLHGVVNSKADSTVERLTDVSKYTGSHKQRFDETGRGKGIAGRKDIPDTSGYVRGYQNKNTYAKTH